MDKFKIFRTLLDIVPYSAYILNAKDYEILEVKNIQNTLDLGTLPLPLLHSIEKLIYPILPEGKIPLYELLKLALPVEVPDTFFEGSRMEVSEGCVHYFGTVQFSYNIESGYFLMFVQSMPVEVHNYQKLYDKLDEWHFNRRNLETRFYHEKSLMQSTIPSRMKYRDTYE